MNKQTILICVIFSCVITSLIIGYYIDQIEVQEKIDQPETKIQNHLTGNDEITKEIEFTVNLKEDGMEHGDTLTISGTVPTPNSPITGMIYRGSMDSPEAAIVYLLQTTSDENGFYSHNVIINDDYLWKKDANYTVSIENNGEHKTLEFSR